jgi:TusA-related sulfurtransferase
MAAIDDWSGRAADICENLDCQLDLSASVTDDSTTVATAVDMGVSTVDLSSFGCPLHYIKARNALRQYQDGDVIDFVFASGDPARQAASSLESDGHDVMAIEENGVTTQIRVRKSA